jgi:hypothetical protein
MDIHGLTLATTCPRLGIYNYKKNVNNFLKKYFAGWVCLKSYSCTTLVQTHIQIILNLNFLQFIIYKPLIVENENLLTLEKK